MSEIHESKAPSGNKFLLIGLAQSDSRKLVPGEFSLETFQTMMMESHEEICILGKDDSQSYYSQMGAWIEHDFVIGFTVPLVEPYPLYWPQNEPILLNAEQ